HRQLSEYPPLFRNVTEAELRDPVRRQTLDAGTIKDDGSTLGGYKADHGFHGRGLAGAVTAQQHDDFSPPNLQRQIGQDMGTTVIGIQVRDAQHYCASEANTAPVPR